MKTILIAEDELELQSILSASIEELGYKSILADNGKIAWDMLCHGTHVDLLLTDIIMPEMDGRTLITHVRNDETLSKLPIIIMSGYVGVKDLSDLLVQGATAFLPKPVSLSDLDEYTSRYFE